MCFFFVSYAMCYVVNKKLLCYDIHIYVHIDVKRGKQEKVEERTSIKCVEKSKLVHTYQHQLLVGVVNEIDPQRLGFNLWQIRTSRFLKFTSSRVTLLFNCSLIRLI